MLTDPNSLLEGDGNQVRYATIKSLKDIRPKALADFIREAARIAALPKEEKTRLFIERDVSLDVTRRKD